MQKPENKERMIFQTGKNGVLKNSYFRYYRDGNWEHRGEGSEESYRHELFKECLSRIKCLEFTVSKWSVKENFNSKEDEERQIEDIKNKLEGENKGHIFGELLVDPISRKYFSTKLYEDEKREKERVTAEFYHLKKLCNEAIDENKNLRNRVKQLEKDVEAKKSKVLRLESNAQAIESENERIKSSFWYKIFGKKKV